MILTPLQDPKEKRLTFCKVITELYVTTETEWGLQATRDKNAMKIL